MNRLSLHFKDKILEQKYFAHKEKPIKLAFLASHIGAALQIIGIIILVILNERENAKKIILLSSVLIFLIISSTMGLRYPKYTKYIFYVESYVCLLFIYSNEFEEIFFDLGGETSYLYYIGISSYYLLFCQELCNIAWYLQVVCMISEHICFLTFFQIKFLSSANVGLILVNLPYIILIYLNQSSTKNLFVNDQKNLRYIKQLKKTIEHRIPAPIAILRYINIQDSTPTPKKRSLMSRLSELSNSSYRKQPIQQQKNGQKKQLQVLFQNQQFHEQINITQILKKSIQDKIMSDQFITSQSLQEPENLNDKLIQYFENLENQEEMNNTKTNVSIQSQSYQGNNDNNNINISIKQPEQSYQLNHNGKLYNIILNRCDWMDEKLSILIILSNISEQQQVMELQKLKAINKYKNHILEAISHNLKTPLISIQSNLELIKSQIDNQNLIDQTENAEKNCKLLKLYINNIIDYSNIMHQKNLKLEPQNFKLKEAIQYILDIYQTQLDFKNIQLEYNYDQDLEDQEDELEVYNDKLRFQQILINLIGNAIKYTKKGKLTIQIKKNIYKSYQHIKIKIIDTGIGLSEIQQQRLFQVSNIYTNIKQKNQNGIGFGLTIAQLLVGQLGLDPKIELKSSPKQGSEFTFSILQDIDQKHIYRKESVSKLQSIKKKESLFSQAKNPKNSLNYFHNLVQLNTQQTTSNNTNTINNNTNNNLLQASNKQTFSYITNTIESGSDEDNSSEPSIQQLKQSMNGIRKSIFSQNNNSTRGSLSIPSMNLSYQQQILQRKSFNVPKTSSLNHFGSFGQRQSCFLATCTRKTSLNFLIVDDEPFNILSLKHILEFTLKNNFEVVIDTCLDGKEAVQKILEKQKLQQEYYDIIFMDINMPIMDGITAVKQINKMENLRQIPKQKIWICSAKASEQEMEMQYKKLIKVERYVAKPLLQQFIKENILDYYL